MGWLVASSLNLYQLNWRNLGVSTLPIQSRWQTVLFIDTRQLIAKHIRKSLEYLNGIFAIRNLLGLFQAAKLSMEDQEHGKSTIIL
jgi:hypothetical protein